MKPLASKTSPGKTFKKAKHITKQPRMEQNLQDLSYGKNKMNIGIWNFRGISNKMDEVMSSLEQQQICIVFLSFLRSRLQNKQTKISNVMGSKMRAEQLILDRI